MPNIQKNDGTVIAWSGIKVGPVPEHEPMGAELWLRYEAEVGDGSAELAKVAVRVEKKWRSARPAGETTEIVEIEKRVVAAFIEEYVADNRKKPLATGSTNNFSLSEADMLNRVGALVLRPSRVEIGNHGETIPTGEGYFSATLFNPARVDVTLMFKGSTLQTLKQILKEAKGGIHLPASYASNSRVYRALVESLVRSGWNPNHHPRKEVTAQELEEFLSRS